MTDLHVPDGPADPADPDAWRPRPDEVQTHDDLLRELRKLWTACGNPSLDRFLNNASSSGMFQSLVTHGMASKSTLGELRRGARRASMGQFTTMVRGLFSFRSTWASTENDQSADGWLTEAAWTDAWRRAEYNLTRPDLLRPSRTGIYLQTTDQSPGQAVDLLADMEPSHAVTLLLGMPTPVWKEIVAAMPPAKASAIVAAMHHLTGPAVVAAETVGADAVGAETGGISIAAGLQQEADDRTVVQLRRKNDDSNNE